MTLLGAFFTEYQFDRLTIHQTNASQITLTETVIQITINLQNYKKNQVEEFD